MEISTYEKKMEDKGAKAKKLRDNMSKMEQTEQMMLERLK